MKRVLLFFLSMAVLLSMAACVFQGMSDEGAALAETTLPSSGEEAATSVSFVTEETISPELSEALAKFDEMMEYIPAEEWTGLETIAYHEDGLNIDAQYAVLEHPEGSPDPKRSSHEQAKKYDLSQIAFETQKAQYSLNDDCVIAELTLRADSEYEKVYYHYVVNVERWNGNGWDRLLLLFRWQRAAAAMPFVERGQSVTLQWNLDRTVTKLTPGRYRIVGYVDYVPVYAEFELVE